MQALFVWFVFREGDDAGGHTFGFAPSIDTIAAEGIDAEGREQHTGGVDIDGGYSLGDQHHHDERYGFFQIDVFKAVVGHIGHHGQTSKQGNAKNYPAYSLFAA